MNGLTKAQRELLFRANRSGAEFVRGHPSTVSRLVRAGYLEPHGHWYNGEYRITEAGREALRALEKQP